MFGLFVFSIIETRTDQGHWISNNTCELTRTISGSCQPIWEPACLPNSNHCTAILPVERTVTVRQVLNEPSVEPLPCCKWQCPITISHFSDSLTFIIVPKFIRLCTTGPRLIANWSNPIASSWSFYEFGWQAFLQSVIWQLRLFSLSSIEASPISFQWEVQWLSWWWAWP